MAEKIKVANYSAIPFCQNLLSKFTNFQMKYFPVLWVNQFCSKYVQIHEQLYRSRKKPRFLSYRHSSLGLHYYLERKRQRAKKRLGNTKTSTFLTFNFRINSSIPLVTRIYTVFNTNFPCKDQIKRHSSENFFKKLTLNHLENNDNLLGNNHNQNLITIQCNQLFTFGKI